MKRSLWTLQQINAKELATAIHERVSRWRQSHCYEAADSEELLLDADHVVHRVLLLRSWLLHFVGNVHSYFMTRVLHSTEIELADALKTAADLDDILATHCSYVGRVYDRCFLHPSVRVLREAVLKVLALCERLRGFCVAGDGVPAAAEMEAMEETYVRSHQVSRLHYVLLLARILCLLSFWPPPWSR